MKTICHSADDAVGRVCRPVRARSREAIPHATSPRIWCSADFRLPHVADAITNKSLDIAVVGSASSTIGGPSGTTSAYPARLEDGLAAKLPGVDA